MKAYHVTAQRWARGWELHIDGVGVTQSRTLGEAEAMARDYIATDRDIDPHGFTITLTVVLGGTLDRMRQEVQEASLKAATAQSQAAAKSRILVRLLKDAGLSGREVAAVLDISPQRVSQLLDTTPRHTRSAEQGRPGGAAAVA